MSIPSTEFTNWNEKRDAALKLKATAVLALSKTDEGGIRHADQSDAYRNQQYGADSLGLKIDTGYGDVPYDMFSGETAPQGFPETTATEQAILNAALKAAYAYTDTIPAQVQLSLMLASKKAHNNWRQRRQQLLTHAQMLAANKTAIDADLAKLTAGKNLDGTNANNV